MRHQDREGLKITAGTSQTPTFIRSRAATAIVTARTGAQRVKAGLKRAIAQAVKLGRPKIDSTTERKVRKQLAKGVGILRVAKSLGIGTGTVQRIANELR
jgi:DNA invertase Pin-like site-specific DNA recombinase